MSPYCRKQIIAQTDDSTVHRLDFNTFIKSNLQLGRLYKNHSPFLNLDTKDDIEQQMRNLSKRLRATRLTEQSHKSMTR